MPWRVERSGKCPPSRPWAVVNQASGAVEGCHANQQAAQRQQAALYANEPSARRSGRMDSKALQRFEIKNADKGEVSAVFSTFNVIDSDGDVTLPGAFKEGAEVVISSYQHTTWGGALPVGKGRIRTTRSEAILDGQFFLDTQAGRETFTVVKQLGPRQQWSYGYDAIDAEPGQFDGKSVRFLKQLEVPEVSPVLVGAGVNTRTLAVKALTDGGMDPKEAVKLVERTVVSEYKAAIRPHETLVTTKTWHAAELDEALGDGASIPDFRSVYAWCDPTGDPELKSSYRFPHHLGPSAEANVQACLVGIAKLNNALGPLGIPDEDRRGVYNHLAAHLADADFEPSELQSGSQQPVKLNDRLIAHLAVQDELLAEVSGVGALRASKGKSLSALTHFILGWMLDGSKALRSAYDSPQEDAARELARFLASLQPSEHQENA